MLLLLKDIRNSQKFKFTISTTIELCDTDYNPNTRY